MSYKCICWFRPKQPEKKYDEFDDDDDYDEDFNFGPVTETPKLEAITLGKRARSSAFMTVNV